MHNQLRTSTMENSFEETLSRISYADHLHYDRVNEVLDKVHELLQQRGLTQEAFSRLLGLPAGQSWTDLTEADFYEGVRKLEAGLGTPLLFGPKLGSKWTQSPPAPTT
jgi:hypothetical protein